jgi:threonine dehydrogenase-like Zn-dependent dehydrogenase
MTAAVLQDIGVLALEDRPVPSPKAADDVVVRVRACGVCGTDLHILSDPPGYPAEQGVVLGHEIVGDVEQIGLGVSSVAIGDRVAIRPILTCGSCRACLRGLTNHCERMQDLGVKRDGGLAELLLVPASACIRISPRIPVHIAALIEPLACVVNAVGRVAPAAGENVVVIGAGAIGLLFTAVLKANGAGTITVLATSPERAQAARSLGATDVIDPRAANPIEAVSQLLPDGPDIVIDAVGSQLATAVGIAGPRARILLFGLNDHAKPEVAQSQITKKELTVVGSFVGQNAFPDAVRLLESGLLDLSPIVSHRVDLDGLMALLPDLRAGRVIKAVVALS